MRYEHFIADLQRSISDGQKMLTGHTTNRDQEFREWHGARRLAEQQNAVRRLRTCMRDITGAEALLTDLEHAQALSVRVRDRLRSLIEHLN